MTVTEHPGSTTSSDGTSIGYRSVGSGPGLVIWHGSMQSAASHADLAGLLADRFTVHLVDRRGRGTSGDGPHSLSTEVADVAAVLEATESNRLFGVSSGAVVALEAALVLPELHRVVAFEPALVVDGAISLDFVDRYRRELADGDIAGALVTGMLGAQMGPPLMQKLPRGLLRWMTAAMVRRQQRTRRVGELTMGDLAPTLTVDFGLVEEAQHRLDAYGAIDKPLLLLGGEKSPRYLHTALDALAERLPAARRVELPGVGHGVTGPADQGGAPALVVPVLSDFLGRP